MVPYTNEHGLRDYRVGVATCSDTPGAGRWVGWLLGVIAVGSLIGVLARVSLSL